MAKKKYKKRQHSPTVAERSRAKNRWNPAGQALLWSDLVFLAAASLLDINDLISDTASALCTLVGVILLFAALWLLFGNKKGQDGPGGRSRL